MDHDEALERLGTRETELARVAARGRRRALVIMLLGCVPGPFLVRWLNHDTSMVALIPFGSAFGGIWYSWSKWGRRPEDTQSIAFAGLVRSQRRAAYRSLLTGSAIEDPIVLTIVDSMHQHVQRTGWTAVLGVAGLTATTALLMGFSGAVAWPATAAVTTAGAVAIGAGWWITRQAGRVVAAAAVAVT
jgi:hypothetical protein